MGNRRCAAEGCNALEFRSEGWCQRHRDGNDPILPANAPNWWEEQPEGDDDDSGSKSSTEIVVYDMPQPSYDTVTVLPVFCTLVMDGSTYCEIIT